MLAWMGSTKAPAGNTGMTILSPKIEYIRKHENHSIQYPLERSTKLRLSEYFDTETFSIIEANIWLIRAAQDHHEVYRSHNHAALLVAHQLCNAHRRCTVVPLPIASHLTCALNPIPRPRIHIISQIIIRGNYLPIH